ncbi:MAG: STAS domain-containing protein [Chlamydiae bacterium]|nr:STAS domain-containing protein [Chlamydiota bacterium]
MIRLQGRLDAISTPGLEKQVGSFLEKTKNVLIDFSKVEYLSSAGMRFLLGATKKMKAKGGKIAFFGMVRDVYEIIKLAGFDRILSIYPSEGEALKAI